MTGIYAPEMVVFTAWRQWCSARLVRDAALEGADPLGDSEDGFRPAWTMVHGFFACAGGFALESPGISRNKPHAEPQDDLDEESEPIRLTLTAKGVALLARCGHVPEVAIEDIRDKSKANSLAKATVVVQASWMLLQIIGRLCARLPVTLLEVNTVAHMQVKPASYVEISADHADRLCAFSMYIFWWNKPLLPKHPVIIRDKSLAPLAKYMYACSEISGASTGQYIRSQTLIKTLLAHLRLYSKVTEVETISLIDKSEAEALAYLNGCDDEFESIDTDSATMGSSQWEIRGMTNNCTAMLKELRRKEAGTAFFERRPKVLLSPPDAFTSANEKLKHDSQTLLSEALDRHPFLVEERKAMTHVLDDGFRCWHIKPDELVATHIRNWPGSDLLRDVDGLRVGIVLWAANVFYAAIHATAWNEHFPTRIEQVIWRLSVCYIGFCGGLWVFLNTLVLRSRKLNMLWEQWMDGKKSEMQSVVLSATVIVFGLSLVMARAYIVVEAFISIRQLPAAAYQTASWSNVLPHFR